MTANQATISIEVIPLPYWDDATQQWYPSVKTLIGGCFHSWEVYEMGFDEARFTLPYARDFARQKMSLIESAVMSLNN